MKSVSCIHGLLVPTHPFYPFTCLSVFPSSAPQRVPNRPESCLPTHLSLTHAPYVPQFPHVAADTHVSSGLLGTCSAGLPSRLSGILNSPSSATAASTHFPAHSAQPAIIKQTGLFVTSWFTHQQVIFSDFAMDGFALLTLNKNSSPKNAE